MQRARFFILVFLCNLSVLLPESGRAEVSFEQIVTQTTPEVPQAEIKKLEKRLLGSWELHPGGSRVSFIDTEYIVPGPGFLTVSTRLSATGGKTKKKLRPPRYNIASWDLVGEGSMSVSAKSLEEIDSYLKKLDAEVKLENKTVLELKKKRKSANKEQKSKINIDLIKRAVPLAKKKATLKAIPVIREMFVDAQAESIKTLTFVNLHVKSNSEVRYVTTSGKIRSVNDPIEETFVSNKPIIMFDNGFYTLVQKTAKVYKFEKYYPAVPAINSQSNHYLDEAYEYWNKRCAVLRQNVKHLKNKSIIAECAKSRDQFLKLGTKPRSEYIYFGEKNLRLPNKVETDLYAKPTSENAEKPGEWPLLDYWCYDSDRVSRNLDYELLASRQFSNTAWSLTRMPRYHAGYNPIGKNWSDEDRATYHLVSGVSSIIYLRDDNVIGINNVFDNRHRWSFSDDQIHLGFFDKKINLKVDANKMGFAYSQYPYAEDDTLFTYQIRLIGSWGIGFKIRHDTDYLNNLNTRFVPPNNRDDGCNKTPPKDVSTKTKKVEKKPEAKSNVSSESNGVYILSDYGHISVVTVDPNFPLDKDFRATWEKGFYIVLRKDGLFGFNADTPGDYLFFPIHKWSYKNDTFRLSLGEASYTFKLPASSANAPKSFVTLDNETKQFRMTLVTKGDGEE